MSAWHSGAELVPGQVRTAAKSDEITAIAQLLDAVDRQGAVRRCRGRVLPQRVTASLVIRVIERSKPVNVAQAALLSVRWLFSWYE